MSNKRANGLGWGNKRAISTFGERVWRPRNSNSRADRAVPLEPNSYVRESKKGSKYRQRLEEQLSKKRNWTRRKF